ncbi:Lipoprotein signal peptidase (fragment) [Imperialibacter sp. EC-SDR9]
MTVLGICFMVGGGVGNIYDRLIYGSVTDFLHIDFVLFQTGIFNMADVSIMTGMFVILFDSYLKRAKLIHTGVSSDKL